jgi:hypothetical protein
MEAEEPDPMPTAPLPTGTGNSSMASACVARVQQFVPPSSSDAVVVSYMESRTAARPDGLSVVEVPYSLSSNGTTVDGSYVCGVDAAGAFVFFSDHERLTSEQWDGYVAARRPGNLQAAR